MKIFVDEKEMPKSCWECPLHDGEDGYCNITHCSCQDKRPYDCPLKTIKSVQNEKAVGCLQEINKILADAIIEITEPLDKLDFYDLEKIARCFEYKVNQLIAESKGSAE